MRTYKNFNDIYKNLFYKYVDSLFLKSEELKVFVSPTNVNFSEIYGFCFLDRHPIIFTYSILNELPNETIIKINNFDYIVRWTYKKYGNGTYFCPIFDVL